MSFKFNSKPKSFRKNGFLQPTLGVIFQLCSEPDDIAGTTGDDDDDSENTPCVFAANILEGVISSYPAKQVYNAAVPFLSQYMENPDPLMRKAGFVGMTILVETCSEQMRSNLQRFVDYTIDNFTNPSPQVKLAALATLAQFSEHLWPEIQDYHGKIIPAIFALLSGTDPEFQSKGCSVFESFAANMGTEILQYAPQIMDCLLRIIASGTPDLKESALSALSAMLEACGTGDNIAPYLASIMAAVKPLCYITKDEEILVRGRALECIGVIAVMVGKERFYPFIPEMTQNALEGLKIDSAFSFELQELTLKFLENIAQVVGKEFTALLPSIMPFCLSTLKSQEFDEFANTNNNLSKVTSELASKNIAKDVLDQVKEVVDVSTDDNDDNDDPYDEFGDAIDNEDEDAYDDPVKKKYTFQCFFLFWYFYILVFWYF